MAEKKNFLGSLARGINRDGELRHSLEDRFSKADKVIGDRPNGLLVPTTPVETPAVEALDGVTDPVRGVPADVASLVAEKGVRQRFATLPIDTLQSNPLNSRSYYNPEAIEARAVSIQKEGQLVPVLVTPDRRQPGKYLLIDGHYRRLAMQSIGRKQMDCCVLDDLEPVDFYRLSKALNHEREGETVLDVAFGLKKLRDNGIAATDEELVSIAGENATKISKLLALLDLPAGARDIIQEHPAHFGINTAYELTLFLKASDVRSTEQFATRIVAENLTFRKVEAIRKTAELGKRPKKQLSRQYRIMGDDGRELGTLKEWDSGRVVLDIRFDDTQQRDGLISEIKTKFGLDSSPRA